MNEEVITDRDAPNAEFQAAIAKAANDILDQGYAVVKLADVDAANLQNAIATANRVLMLEHAIYSVISPEGAASILWRDTSKAQDAATSMKITAQDLERFGVIDLIVNEPVGGAHRDPGAVMAATGDAIAAALGELRVLNQETLRRQRREKFLSIGRSLG